MPPGPTRSNIRASVRWKEPSVYAGEEIECIITFRNIATVPGQASPTTEDVQTPGVNGYNHERRQSYASATQSRRSSVVQSTVTGLRTPSISAGKSAAQTRGHRPALSLNVVSAPSRGGLHGTPIHAKTPTSAVRSTKGHGRSLSIMSFASDAPSAVKPGTTTGTADNRVRPSHSRSSSVQSATRHTSQPVVGLGIPSRQPSPLYESTTPPLLAEEEANGLTIKPGRRVRGTASAGNTPQVGQEPFARRTSRTTGLPDFQFPGDTSNPKASTPPIDRPRPPRSPSTMHSANRPFPSPKPPDGWSGGLPSPNPLSRVMSESSAGGTPRTSSDIYSISNHSDETVTSEMPNLLHANGLLSGGLHSGDMPRSRQSSYGGPVAPEFLMMGHVQTMGFFTIDGSLVNAAPFEEVKRKGVQSGGGVVGIEQTKRSSGMFGAFSWGNIGESLGGLLGGDDMSSMAQMKATAGSKSIPLLSTPQTLLFVDLRLAPGESRSYNYRFKLPRGLPPTHRGRAMRVYYHIALGIQRPEGQKMKHVEVPFRVLGSYNARGETLGHDLMSPYILLQDGGRAASVTSSNLDSDARPVFASDEMQGQKKTPKQGLEDFLRYTERLLEAPRDGNGALLSPTSPISPMLSRTHSHEDNPSRSIKQAIDFAILRANVVETAGSQKASERQSVNRFNIARSGQPAAVLTLLRPAYKLGESVVGTIDFTAPDRLNPAQPAPTHIYAVVTELESTERIDPSLALRSGSSIRRATRKVHASAHENTLFARRASFNLVVPATATPTFETTGVSLIWKLRVVFTTSRQTTDGDNEDPHVDAGLLEELGSDEKGTNLIAREYLPAETFEIEVPLKVYGTPGVEGGGDEDALLEV